MRLSDPNIKAVIARPKVALQRTRMEIRPSRSIHQWPIGTIIEFPDTFKEARAMKIPVKSFKVWNPRIQSRDTKGRFSTMGVWETHTIDEIVIIVLKDKKPTLLSLPSLRSLIRNIKVSKHYKFNQEMRDCTSDYDRLNKLLGRTFCIAAKKRYSKPVFKDGELTNKRKMYTFSILQEVH